MPREVTNPSDTLLPAPISLQFSGNPTPSGWRIKGQCVETWPSSSASYPLQCRNTLALCLGRKTQFPSSQVRRDRGWWGRPVAAWSGAVSELVIEQNLDLVSDLLLFW